MINLDIIWNNCKKLDNESWIDLEDKKMFYLNKNWKNSSSKESFFISDKNDFLYNNNWDLNYVLSYYGSIWGMDVISNSESQL